jgi:hypothetical protein
MTDFADPTFFACLIDHEVERPFLSISTSFSRWDTFFQELVSAEGMRAIWNIYCSKDGDCPWVGLSTILGESCIAYHWAHGDSIKNVSQSPVHFGSRFLRSHPRDRVCYVLVHVPRDPGSIKTDQNRFSVCWQSVARYLKEWVPCSASPIACDFLCPDEVPRDVFSFPPRTWIILMIADGQICPARMRDLESNDVGRKF